MISGMDTDSMVEQMLSGTQSKIDKQVALKQQTLWKQEIYRDVTTSINEFYGKYFDTAYGSALSNNFASSTFFNSMISSVKSGSAVKIMSTSTSATAGDIRMAVKQLATSAKMESTRKMSGSETITGKTINEGMLKMFEKQVSS